MLPKPPPKKTNKISFMFHSTILPSFLVKIYAYLLPFAELGVGICLLLGFKLRETWIATALLLISLGLGLMVAQQSAADIYVYIVIAFTLALFPANPNGPSS